MTISSKERMSRSQNPVNHVKIPGFILEFLNELLINKINKIRIEFNYFITANNSGHFAGKSSLPIILIASLN